MSAPRARASEQLRNLLDDDEELLWRGTPHRIRLLVTDMRILIPILVPLGMVGLFVTWMVALWIEFSGGDPMSVFAIMGAIGLVVVLLIALAVYWLANRSYDHAEYAATEDRLIAFSGTFGRDYSGVSWDSVRDLEVAVGPLDRLFDTGSIHVATEGSGDISFRYLEHPHELAATFESIRAGEKPAQPLTDEGLAAGKETEPTAAETGGGFDFEREHDEEVEPADREDRSQPTGRRARQAGPGAEDVSATLEGLLRADEELRWHYRPHTGTYLKVSVVGAVLVGLILWSIFYGLFVGIPVFAELGPAIEALLGISVVSAFLAGWLLMQVIWVVGVTVLSYRASDRLEFAVTDQRAIKVGGMVGLDTSAVAWETVTDVEVDRNLMTKLFGTAYVYVRTGGGGQTYRGGGVRFGPVQDAMAAVERIEAIRRGEDQGAPILVRGAPSDPPPVDAPDPSRLSAQAKTLLRDGEELLWCGRPSFIPYVGPSLLGGAVFTAVGIVLLSIGWGLFAVFVVFGGLSTAGKRLLSYRNAEYVATDRRVLAFGGGIGRDSSSVDWDDVQDVEVETGPFDGPFGTGTLRFSRAGAATPTERQSSGNDSDNPFTGVRFQRVPDARSIAEVLEHGRST